MISRLHVALASAFALAVPALVGVHSMSCAPANAEAKQPVAEPVAPESVATAIAEERTLPTLLEVTGDLEADARVDVAPEIDGRVVRAELERGQLVAAGDVLFQLDARDAQNRLAEAVALEAQIAERLGIAHGETFDPSATPDVRQARVAYERAAADAQRYANVVESGAVSRSTHDLAQAQAREAEQRLASELDRARDGYRGLEAQRARVALARKAVEDTQVRAPWSGRVLERRAEAGQFVRKGDILATLVKVDVLRVKLAVPEVAVSAVHAGQKVSLAVQAWANRRFDAAVTFVGPGLDRSSRALVIEARVDNSSGELQPGLFATARIEIDAGKPAVIVPAAATNESDGVQSVWIVAGGKTERRFVQLGRVVESSVEVVRGLRASEVVVVSGSERLVDGAQVAVRATEGR